MIDFKEKAELARNAKKMRNSLNTDNASNVQPTDMMFVLHKDEAITLEDVILDVLSGQPIKLTKEQKQHLVKIVNYIQED